MDRKQKIKLSPDDVQEFVKVAGTCDFDIDIFYNRVVIDAKSILGVLSLDLKQILTVRYGGNNQAFEQMLDRYSIA